MNKQLQERQDTASDTPAAFAPEAPANGIPAPRLRDPRTGRYALAPAEAAARAARLDALRLEVEGAVTEGRLPPSLVALWRDELGLVVDALRGLTPSLTPTTATGRVSRGYRDYVLLVERAATLARWLGLNAADPTKRPARTWSKLSRAEQEAEAARALAEVEANLRAPQSNDEEE